MSGRESAASAEVEANAFARPYARKTFAEVVDDYVLVRGDLTEQYAREQLVREHDARVQAARDEERARADERAARDQRRYDCVAEALHKAVIRAERAEAELRDARGGAR